MRFLARQARLAEAGNNGFQILFSVFMLRIRPSVNVQFCFRSQSGLFALLNLAPHGR